jgi:hypothetical protein
MYSFNDLAAFSALTRSPIQATDVTYAVDGGKRLVMAAD